MEPTNLVTLAVGLAIAVIAFFLKRTLSQIDKKLDALTEKIEPLPLQVHELRVRISQLEDRMHRIDGLGGARS